MTKGFVGILCFIGEIWQWLNLSSESRLKGISQQIAYPAIAFAELSSQRLTDYSANLCRYLILRSLRFWSCCFSLFTWSLTLKCHSKYSSTKNLYCSTFFNNTASTCVRSFGNAEGVALWVTLHHLTRNLPSLRSARPTTDLGKELGPVKSRW
jgi:hypothetical protein